MERLNELLREYAQAIRRDDGTGFMHADAIRELFRARAASANETGAEGAVNTGDRLTDEKANHIIQRDGYKLTGAVLCASDGRRCIVDLGAVRWLTKAEAWKLMHPDESRSPAMAAEAVAIPTGWKLVPVEPTEEMIDAARTCAVGWSDGFPDHAEGYAAMIAAAPQPARVDTRVWLTDEQREALEYAIVRMDLNARNRDAYTAAKELRALLNGANHAK
ncbi:hypothetical protein KGP95_13320 [Burkholderia multivorans]|uniref:hypothetical protein n=1 Tax=Burkholderia multivorans TaxID=87883 RepID=UPI0020A03068|nr:hypothetical protein [Burkholderia multivorans]MCO8609685.1 hypothetical protein [Burkholderia multivorans]MCO8638310.1 hypothetical protein [Burkholderia multivorans]MCO8644534.1 hypothetical protein [Burkholderia multivorans]